MLIPTANVPTCTATPIPSWHSSNYSSSVLACFKFNSGLTFHSLVQPHPSAVDLSINAMNEFIGINLSLVTTHLVCGVRRVGNSGWRGHASLVDQVMRCLNLKSILTLAVSSNTGTIGGKRVGTFTVGISTRFEYDSRTFFLSYRDVINLTVEVCLKSDVVETPTC